MFEVDDKTVQLIINDALTRFRVLKEICGIQMLSNCCKTIVYVQVETHTTKFVK